jgi:hypothetical protein
LRLDTDRKSMQLFMEDISDLVQWRGSIDSARQDDSIVEKEGVDTTEKTRHMQNWSWTKINVSEYLPAILKKETLRFVRSEQTKKPALAGFQFGRGGGCTFKFTTTSLLVF